MSPVPVRTTAFAAGAAVTAAVAATTLGAAAAAGRGARAAVAMPTPTPPAKVTGRLIRRQRGTAPAGRRVPAAGVGQRVFVNARDGFALGGIGEAQYPAATTDGGATWKTTGPALHVNAAQGPLAVTTVGVVSRRTYFYYGAGTVVDSTGDGGKHWWRAFLGDDVLAVVPGAGGGLVAIAQKALGANTNKAVTWVYVSKDGGQVWRYDANLGAF